MNNETGKRKPFSENDFQNKSDMPLENNTDAQIDNTTHFGPKHPTELTTCPTFMTWHGV